MWTELTGEQIGRERMRFFERLKAAASAEWRIYAEHVFLVGEKPHEFNWLLRTHAPQQTVSLFDSVLI